MFDKKMHKYEVSATDNTWIANALKFAAFMFGVTIIILCVMFFCNEVTSPKPSPEAKLVLENDGVKVYKFNDGYRDVYYTDARGCTEWNSRSGKTSIPMRVETVK